MASPSNYDCYEEDLQSFLGLYAILQQSAPHEGIQDSSFVLCVVNSLQNAFAVLRCISNDESHSGNDRQPKLQL